MICHRCGNAVLAIQQFTDYGNGTWATYHIKCAPPRVLDKHSLARAQSPHGVTLVPRKSTFVTPVTA